MGLAGPLTAQHLAESTLLPPVPGAGHVALLGAPERGQQRPRYRGASPPPVPTPDLRKTFRIARRNLGAAVLPLLGPPTVRALARTWRVERLDEHHLRAAEAAPGRLLALWHGRMLVGMPDHARRGYTVLVSPSDDGGLMDVLLRRFGYRVVRGSTSQGGARALRELLVELRAGGTIVITPDGPRGPRHVPNTGLAWMAARTGFPIVPVGFACDRAWHLRSWDRFTVPRPRARIATVYAEPLAVEARDDATLARATEEVRARLQGAEARAAAHLGVASDAEGAP